MRRAEAEGGGAADVVGGSAVDVTVVGGDGERWEVVAAAAATELGMQKLHGCKREVEERAFRELAQTEKDCPFANIKELLKTARKLLLLKTEALSNAFDALLLVERAKRLLPTGRKELLAQLVDKENRIRDVLVWRVQMRCRLGSRGAFLGVLKGAMGVHYENPTVVSKIMCAHTKSVTDKVVAAGFGTFMSNSMSASMKRGKIRPRKNPNDKECPGAGDVQAAPEQTPETFLPAPGATATAFPGATPETFLPAPESATATAVPGATPETFLLAPEPESATATAVPKLPPGAAGSQMPLRRHVQRWASTTADAAYVPAQQRGTHRQQNVYAGSPWPNAAYYYVPAQNYGGGCGRFDSLAYQGYAHPAQDYGGGYGSYDSLAYQAYAHLAQNYGGHYMCYNSSAYQGDAHAQHYGGSYQSSHGQLTATVARRDAHAQHYGGGYQSSHGQVTATVPRNSARDPDIYAGVNTGRPGTKRPVGYETRSASAGVSARAAAANISASADGANTSCTGTELYSLFPRAVAACGQDEQRTDPQLKDEIIDDGVSRVPGLRSYLV